MVTDSLATTIQHRCLPHSPFDCNKEEGEEIGAHEGILASSIKLCEELKPVLDEKLPEGYSVELVGHSLGAGAAGIAALLLRSQYKELHEPNKLHAYCFAPPPVLDHRVATKSKDFITSIVNRNDCISRMAIANVEILIRMLELFHERILEREKLNSFFSIAKEMAFGSHFGQLDDEQFEELFSIAKEAQEAVHVSENLMMLY